jgi:signal transduction histidine kinase/CheY-like chemotaxis protein
MPTIVVVDDVASIRKVMAKFIARMGHRVLEASSAAEAIEITRRERPELIISDILMPGMDGFELARQLRSDPANENLQILLCSAAYDENEARGLAADCRIAAFIQKPAEPKVWQQTIEAALRATPPTIIPSAEPAAAPMANAAAAEPFEQQHQRLISGKLLEKVNALTTTTTRLSSLLALGQKLAGESDPLAQLNQFCNSARSIMGAKYAAMGIRQTTTDPRRLFVGGERHESAARPPLEPAFLIEVMDKRRPMRFDAQGACPCNPEYLANIFGANIRRTPAISVGAVVAAPIATSAETYGWICFAQKPGIKQFDAEDQQLAITLGAQLAVAYENAIRLHSILRHNETLEQRIADRTSELRRSNQELEQFSYTAAHDLQAPLNTVMGYLRRLERVNDERLDADARQAMEGIVRAAAGMQQLIQDVLNYSKLDGRRRAFQPVESELAVKTALDNLSADIAQCSARIEVGGLPIVRADSTQLAQIFQNLIHNAIKFRGEGSPVVKISAEQNGPDWTFCVRDNGIGIAPEHSERIFNLFERVCSVEQFPGSGIGLAVCKKIVEQHGGRIWIESKVGEGASFYFTMQPAAMELARSAA